MTQKSTELQAVKTPATVKSLFSQDNVKLKFEEMLGKKAQGFIASVLQVVAGNGLLVNADAASVYNAAMMAATLDLPINNNLGFAYIIPYKTKQSDGSFKNSAQFQLGYKGFIQLAQRSGVFKTISAAPIYEGQLVESNPLTGFEFDFSKQDSQTIIGFAAYFKLLNGFEKTLYMSVKEMEGHGAKYSKTFSNSYGLWKTDFVGMGSKTVIKLLLSKFAPLSIEMQTAVRVDQAVINDAEGKDLVYADYSEVKIDKELERLTMMISDCKTVDELAILQENNPNVDVSYFDTQYELITKQPKTSDNDTKRN